MALAETTLSTAFAVGDKVINVASATSFAAGRLVKIGDTLFKVSKGYSNSVDGTAVSVFPGWDGTAVKAWPASARVVHGDPSDFAAKAPGQHALYPVAGRPRDVVEYSTTATMALPSPGSDRVVILNGTAFTLTVPVPTKDLDGCIVHFVGSQSAAYVLEFTGGLNGASTGYETITNASSSPAFMVIAANETWHNYVAGGLTGTATNIVAAVS